MSTAPPSLRDLEGLASRLRQMLDTLVEHEERVWAAEERERVARGDRPPELEVLDLGALPDAPPPRWVSRMEAAAKDGVAESLRASIREEGWRAFAEGGKDGMHALADRACGAHEGHYARLDSLWNMIGVDGRGMWVY